MRGLKPAATWWMLVVFLSMKSLVIALIVLFLLLQYRLWFAGDGIVQVIRLKHQIAVQQAQNEELAQKNSALAAEVISLKKGTGAIENRARSELGMIKKGEVFYQVVK